MNEQDRVTGSLYGMATGDALGVPSSFMTQDYIAEKWAGLIPFIHRKKVIFFMMG